MFSDIFRQKRSFGRAAGAGEKFFWNFLDIVLGGGRIMELAPGSERYERRSRIGKRGLSMRRRHVTIAGRLALGMRFKGVDGCVVGTAYSISPRNDVWGAAQAEACGSGS